MNRDIQIPKDSDYVLKLELLGENNVQYEFAEESTLTLILNNIKNDKKTEIDIDISEFENPKSIIISRAILADYPADPIKYKLVMTKPEGEEEITITLCFGNFYRE